MRSVLRAIALLVFGEYRLSRIYRLDLREFQPASRSRYDLRRITKSEVERNENPKMRDRSGYGGENAYGFALWQGGELASMCWFWDGRRFRDHKLWELGPNEAIMVDLVTADRYRGRGFAVVLTDFAAEELKQEGFKRLVTWVWPSNYPSIRSFEKAGWSYIAFVANVTLFHSRKSIRLAWNVSSRSRR